MDEVAEAMVKSLEDYLDTTKSYDLSGCEFELDVTSGKVILKPYAGGWRPYLFKHKAADLAEWLYFYDYEKYKETTGADTLEGGIQTVRGDADVANEVCRIWFAYLNSKGVLRAVLSQKLNGEYFVYDVSEKIVKSKSQKSKKSKKP